MVVACHRIARLATTTCRQCVHLTGLESGIPSNCHNVGRDHRGVTMTRSAASFLQNHCRPERFPKSPARAWLHSPLELAENSKVAKRKHGTGAPETGWHRPTPKSFAKHPLLYLSSSVTNYSQPHQHRSILQEANG